MAMKKSYFELHFNLGVFVKIILNRFLQNWNLILLARYGPQLRFCC
jgi:hypothetical protein